MQGGSKKLLKNEKGFTLMELLVSVAILALIVGALLGAFVSTTKTNITSGAIVDEGYIAQDMMEKIYTLSQSKTITDIITHMTDMTDPMDSTKGFIYTADPSAVPDRGDYTFDKEIDGFYVRIKIQMGYIITSPYKEMSRVIVGIYDDPGYTKNVTKMQNYLKIEH